MTMIKHTCSTCKHWEAFVNHLEGWGICTKLQTSSKVDITSHGWESTERIDTFKTFFCAEHPGFKDDK